MARQIFTHTRILAAILAGAMALAAAPVASANDTVALKNALYAAGYDINNVSPQMDDTTRSALTAFQKDQGLNASGVLDDATKKALGMVHVQVAAAGSSGNAGASQDAGTSSAAAEPEADESAEQAQEDDIEEDDDGGWSFF
ncbi:MULTISPECIES: peptidoglycan-binding domain-containing protein [Marinobacter]|jgi:peptidoglycan hydrolase-like protein with peptidoglycan-binding domain|uniref:peptidoglycan-binding domain-containing protein n=1 Tax=Marinobacter TaxID=2742 RepID=UPI000569E1B6|nr:MULTISPECIES: peptidoglycan-binding domain-containing protein [Marinobacter]MCC4284474.1 peptidoglycan-binding protein [Marinobacter salarius]MDM8180813.1 peptidoglycan-binding domain-containing protein [Marinobacter salarius]MDP4534499.1 peptidoglycan-binding domain-containing protein [Marinobacter salarius]OLF84722.1 peptidoglycan-binding protein [Marinobacter sp. C18]VVT09965.1 Peptidoglycan-binding protein [Marinobacter salarius]